MAAPGSANPNLEPRRAWHCVRCHVRLWVVLGVVLAGDLVSKQVAFSRLGEPGSETHHPHTVVPNVLEFVTQYNPGAALGILRHQTALFVIVGVVALAVFLAFFAHSEPRQWFFQTGIALVLSGALGNLYDRIFHWKHEVRDFIHITVRGGREWIGRWPADGFYPWVFNIADMALVVGVIVIMLASAHHAKKRRAAKA